MGGRIYGFLAGALFTSSLTYLAREQFKSDQVQISTKLRSYQKLINEGDQLTLTDNKLEYQTRPWTEAFKDLWNEEVIKTVNRIYSIRWYEDAKYLVDKVEGK
ncbi:BA75_00925T0 [Komagataella pastoris]|uniref:MICOS complex subunit MIC12 n=1 Tax=Komagataella pastoris TaxID=4922 RepID=A0A1B2J5G1_PICPA|nr:BA75_00925T0 [Komagataella pastoris]